MDLPRVSDRIVAMNRILHRRHGHAIVNRYRYPLQRLDSLLP
jgi:hypothetical protein